jgi:hypothetical protein
VFDCRFNTQNSLLLNQHNGDDAPQEKIQKFVLPCTRICEFLNFGDAESKSENANTLIPNAFLEL